MSSQPVKDSLWSCTIRVVLCALAGAFTFSILIAFAEGFRWIGSSSEGGGLMVGLFWLSLLMLEKLFLTPWGTIGALVGAGIGWLTLRARRGQDQRKVDL
ncbi:MAG: hypothetical protein EXS31_10580 [Pedosphaera sp.]|nr:hypothetical protein [Pedosphaera sp.]